MAGLIVFDTTEVLRVWPRKLHAALAELEGTVVTVPPTVGVELAPMASPEGIAEGETEAERRARGDEQRIGKKRMNQNGDTESVNPTWASTSTTGRAQCRAVPSTVRLRQTSECTTRSRERETMERNVIQVERELEDRLRARAREALGPDASEAQVKALADEVYRGPEEDNGYHETEADREAYDREIEETIAMMDRWGV